MHRLLILALLAGCAGGATPTTLAPAGMHQAMAPAQTNCFRLNRFIKEADLRSGVDWRLHPGMRPKHIVGIALAHNSLRIVTIVLRPYNDPEDYAHLDPGGTIKNDDFHNPTFELVIKELNPQKDPGPGAKVNLQVCDI